MPWVTRGLRDGVLTTRYPRQQDGYEPGFRASVAVAETATAEGLDVNGLCPTGAIATRGRQVTLDRGLCILCGRCVETRPDLFSFESDFEVATTNRSSLVVPETPDEDDEALEQRRIQLAERVRALRRSVHIRHVDAGSDGSEEWEIAALNNPVYDIQRLGVFFTASPRHADVLLVTGAGTAGMAGPLRRTWAAMPEPKVVIAAGTDAISGGIVHPTYATRGGVSTTVPVDVWVPGSPPSPFSLLHGILLAVGVITERAPR